MIEEGERDLASHLTKCREARAGLLAILVTNVVAELSKDFLDDHRGRRPTLNVQRSREANVVRLKR